MVQISHKGSGEGPVSSFNVFFFFLWVVLESFEIIIYLRTLSQWPH